jgi:hypothetical protein
LRNIELPEELSGRGVEEIVTKFLHDVVAAVQTACSSHHKGAEWEKEFSKECCNRDLPVTKYMPGRHDMEVNGYFTQCKCIDQVTNGWVAIDNMRPVKANGGERGYKVGEYDVLALRCRGATYLIPAGYLHDSDRPGFLKSRLQLERYQHCIDFWEIFAGQKPLPQGSLF